MFTMLLDLLFPKRSLGGEEGEWITAEERRRLKSFPVILEKERLRLLGIPHLDRIIAGAAYGEVSMLRKAIHTFKYGRVRELAPELARLMLLAAPPMPTDAVLCPVPLHWMRRFERGFNQAELLAEIIVREHGGRILSLLRRPRPTGHQAWRSKEERRGAMDNAFVCTMSVAPRHVILVDDLATSGATLSACAKTLKAAGAERVDAWVVAMGARA